MLSWDSSDLGELNETNFTSPFEAIDDENDFKVNELKYTDGDDSEQRYKVSIFKYNQLSLVLEKFKIELYLPSMKYLSFEYKEKKYLMSQCIKDEYTNQRISRSYTNTYLTSIRKTLAFQWIFCVKCTSLEKTISRMHDIPQEFKIDSSHVVSCFETRYKVSAKNDIKFPKRMIQLYFDKNDEYFISTCQYLLCDGYADLNLYIQHLRDILKITKGDISWFNICLIRIRYILSLPVDSYARYPEMGLLIPHYLKNISTLDK
jgi:hypothetical protein